MKKLWSRIMDMNISKKLVIFVYFSTVCLFTVFGAILIMIGEQQSREQQDAGNMDTVNYANLLVEREQQYLMGLADYFCITPSVQDMLRDSNNGISSFISTDIIEMAQLRLNIVALAFYNIRGEPIDYMSIDQSCGPVDQLDGETERPISRLYSMPRAFEWEYIGQDETRYMLRDNSPKLCLWRMIPDAKTNRPIGSVMVAVDTRKLLGANNPPHSTLSDTIIILDMHGRQMYNRSEIILQDSDAENLLLSAAEDSGCFSSHINGQRYRVAYSHQAGNWFVSYGLIPEETLIWRNQAAIVYALVGIFLCLCLLFPLLIFISHTLTRPIQQLTASMEQFANGDFNVRVSFKYKDEIGILGQVFNKMVIDNKALIDRTYVLRLRERDAELSFLQAQINPHFLYNLIHTIQWKALRKGDEEIADLAYSMGQVFRISLNRGSNIITVEREKDLITYYLKLQKERFGNRVEYVLLFEPETLQVKIPKLIIQPLVENSIVHGAESSSDTVHISVKCFLLSHRNRLRVEVLDDGIGIPPEKLALLPDKLGDPDAAVSSSSHFALRNINDRLQLLFGEEYTFSIKSMPQRGTFIQITIPVDVPMDEPKSGDAADGAEQKMI